MSPTPTATATEAALVRSICRASFYEFVKEFWGVCVPEAPVWNWHIKYLCGVFQEDAERVFRNEPKLHDTIVNISPGSTKSTVLSIMAPAWLHAVRPDIRVLAASHTQALTFELGRKCRMVEDSPLYQAAFGEGSTPPAERAAREAKGERVLEMVPAHDQWTKSLFMNTAGGGRMAATVGGMSPTGFHAHFILVDDPLDPQKAKATSEVEIETANNFMSEVLPSRKVNKKVAPTWLIMQRLHQNDPTGYLLSKGKENVRHICLPAERSSRVKPPKLRRRYVGGLMDPVRLDQEVLDEAKIDLGSFGYAGQYQQYPVPKGGGMFKPAKIEIEVPPALHRREWIGLARGWDKAGTKGGGAYTVGLLLGRWRRALAPKNGVEDEWWILHCERGQWDSHEREEIIHTTARRDRRRVEVGIEQEPGSGGKESAQNTIRRLAGYRVRAIPATGSKEDRADEWSRLINGGCFKMAPGDWNQTLVDELKYFPNGKYKDQVDAGSVAFTLLNRPALRVGAQ
jgi:predicted phage terminase large subunit-like protein